MFKNLLFPTSVSIGVVWGPRFQTEIVIEGGGEEVRNQNWSQPRREADAAKACRTDTEKKDLLRFFRAVGGMAYSFAVKDHSDYTVESGEGVFRAIGDGTYQLVKRYTLDGETSDNDVILPKDGTIVLPGYTEDSHYTIDYATGILTPIGSPLFTPTAWTGEYYVMCRFGTDRIALIAESVDVFRMQSIPLIEVRPEDEA